MNPSFDICPNVKNAEEVQFLDKNKTNDKIMRPTTIQCFDYVRY